MTVFALCIFFTLNSFAQQPADAEKKLALDAAKIFEAKCIQCHSPTSEDKLAAKARKKWKDWQDLDELKRNHIDKTAKLEDTVLWASLISKEDDVMPPKDAKAGALTEAELATVRKWMEAGAPVVPPAEIPKSGAAAAPARKIAHVSDEAMLQLILADLTKMKKLEQQNARYFTLTHFYNNPKETDAKLDLYRQALFKIVNSLHWEKNIVKPKPTDPAKTIYRVDLRDLGWKADDGERIVGVYPYGIEYDGGAAVAVYALANSRHPVLRADWFTFAASQPPLYHDLLGFNDKDKALAELEHRFSVNRLDNIRRGKVIRAGINAGKSGVSANNRLIERHATAYGAYWISYDFSANSQKQNLFDNPLGPPELFRDNQFAFDHAGGEVIFNLPNGFQAYLLVTETGNRLDIAPSDIVHDPNGPRGGQVINGLSCISCHASGMRTATDELRAFLQVKRDTYSKNLNDLLDTLYVPADKLKAAFDRDSKRFLDAQKEAGITSVSPEPVKLLYDRFTENITQETAAAELGLTREEFQQRITAEPTLRGVLAKLEGTGLPRDQFIDVFDSVVVGLKLGTHREYSKIPPPTGGTRSVASVPSGIASAGKQFTNSLGMKFVPVTGTDVLFSIWETRVKDYAAYANATTGVDGSWKNPEYKEQKVTPTEDCPVVNVSWEDARAFCDWLTKKDRDAGKIQKDAYYRLPTDAEWSVAVGLGKEGGNSPKEKDEKIKDVYPWGTQWPPPNGAGNFAGEEAGLTWKIAGYRDGFARTAPVGSFNANKFGLFDMGGNVWEWCEDKYDPSQENRVLRGGSWYGVDPALLLSSFRFLARPSFRNGVYGFRCVLVGGSSSRKTGRCARCAMGNACRARAKKHPD